MREYPTAAMEAALAELGVVCRVLPEVDLPRSNATDTETDLSGFTMKVAALLLSRFQEVTSLTKPQSIADLIAHTANCTKTDLSRCTMKVTALLLMRFQEVRSLIH